MGGKQEACDSRNKIEIKTIIIMIELARDKINKKTNFFFYDTQRTDRQTVAPFHTTGTSFTLLEGALTSSLHAQQRWNHLPRVALPPLFLSAPSFLCSCIVQSGATFSMVPLDVKENHPNVATLNLDAQTPAGRLFRCGERSRSTGIGPARAVSISLCLSQVVVVVVPRIGYAAAAATRTSRRAPCVPRATSPTRATRQIAGRMLTRSVAQSLLRAYSHHPLFFFLVSALFTFFC